MDIYSYLNPSILGKDYRRIMMRKDFVVFMALKIIYSMARRSRAEKRGGMLDRYEKDFF
jgi:hypothetical protein